MLFPELVVGLDLLAIRKGCNPGLEGRFAMRCLGVVMDAIRDGDDGDDDGEDE